MPLLGPLRLRFWSVVPARLNRRAPIGAPTFSVPIEISDLGETRYVPLEAAVDTGSTFSTIPADVLDSLGVVPIDHVPLTLDDGTKVENDVADVMIRVASHKCATRVVFAEPPEPVLLGRVTLETLLLAVDPVNDRLIPVEGRL
jgi:predicted aspartyl protease